MRPRRPRPRRPSGDGRVSHFLRGLSPARHCTAQGCTGRLAGSVWLRRQHVGISLCLVRRHSFGSALRAAPAARATTLFERDVARELHELSEPCRAVGVVAGQRMLRRQRPFNYRSRHSTGCAVLSFVAASLVRAALVRARVRKCGGRPHEGIVRAMFCASSRGPRGGPRANRPCCSL